MGLDQQVIKRLDGFRCYIAGPIDRAPDAGLGWRRDLTPFLRSLNITVLDPTNKPIDIAHENEENIRARHILKQAGQYDEVVDIMKRIRAIDLRLCDICDFGIFHIDLSIFACGTLEELFWCNRMKKPCLIHIEQGVSGMPDWLFGTVPVQHMFGDWQSLKDYLIHVNSAPQVEHLKRWCFLDYGRLKCRM